MQKRAQGAVATLVLICAALAPAAARAASMEIWPSERRTNNTFFCYGSDWNSLQIAIYPEDYGKHRFELPAQFAEPTVLAVTLPASVQFLGADLMSIPGVGKDFATESVTREGKSYRRVLLPLPAEGLTKRLLQGKYYYHVFVWFAAPETLDDQLSYELRYGDRTLAAGSSRLLTAGVLAGNPVFPRRFGFHPYGAATNLPNRDYDRQADFLRRLGVAGIESHWTNGLPAQEPTPQQLVYEANRRHGVKNIANMTLFAMKYGGAYGGTLEETMKRGGLVKAIDESCAGLGSAAAQADWRAAEHYFDLALFDWEPQGPGVWPGYDDPATIAAFAAAQKLPGLTAQAVQKEYREAYARFRMQQLARPLYALKQTIDSVRPIPLRVEQGSGASAHVDYDVYGRDFPALSPMIYQPSPLAYARDLLEMLRSTRLPASTFWPDLTIGWPPVPVHRQSPQEYLLDTVVTAAAGCGSVAHWPGITYSDASWFGIHDGLLRIAPVEDFYLDGKPATGISLTGIPYRSEQITVGNRTLDHSAPDWRASLITFAHELRGEYLLTLLNYHRSEDCFVRLEAPALAGRYLVNREERRYLVADARGRALLRVAKESPAMWIVTGDRTRLAGCQLVAPATFARRFQAARDAFLAAATKSEVQLGKVGDITVAYGLTPFGGEDRMTLQVTTPAQTVAFGSAGGRVYDWRVPGMPPFVAGDSLGTDGLAMDMLWLPAAARWSGDEVAEYTLVGCSNDGRKARVTYEAALQKGLPGVRLKKTYTVAATGTSVGVEVTLRNERVDATPLVISYWSHNVLRAPVMHFIGGQLTHETPKGETAVLTAAGLPAELRKDVVMPEKIIGATGPVYAEFLPDSRSGLIFRLPDNFLSVYRWSHFNKSMSGSEWMSRPLSLAAGASASLRFALTAVAQTAPDKLRSDLATAQEPSAAGAETNLLRHAFGKLNDKGLPEGWQVQTAGANPAAAQVTAAPDETGETVVKLAMPEEATVQLDATEPTRLDPSGDYMLIVQLKVENMHYTGDWYGRPAGVRVYVYGTEDKHTWLAVHGTGSTKGWVTAVLPFPAPDCRMQFAASRVLLRCYNMSGTVSFRAPTIVRRPAGIEVQHSFTLEDGTQVTGGALQLR